MGKKIYTSVDAIKCLAALLVLNSHMDLIYPISALATGGAIGNGLFFFASGFLANNIHSETSFLPWYLKKVKRLIPITAIVAIIRLVIIGGIPTSLVGMFLEIVWPTYYWFVGALLLFYIPYFIIIKKQLLPHIKFIVLGLGMVYVFYYLLLLDTSKWVVESVGMMDINGCFKLIYYFMIMIIGAFTKEDVSSQIENKYKHLCIGICGFICMYTFKVIMGRIQYLMYFQFIVQLCTIITVIGIAKYLLANEERICRYKNTVYFRLVRCISNLSLELFLAQEIVVLYAKRLSFPLSFGVMISGTVILAYIIKSIAKLIAKYIV